MKTLNLLITATIISLLLNSCATIDHNFSKRKYDFGHQTAGKIENKELIQKDYGLTEDQAELTAYEAVAVQNEIISDNINTISVYETKKEESIHSASGFNSRFKVDETQSFIKMSVGASETKIKEVNKNIFGKKENLKKPYAVNGTNIIEVLLAIFLPPVAVFLHEDGLTTNFWIDLILCILFWVPGVVFAFLVILDVI